MNLEEPIDPLKELQELRDSQPKPCKKFKNSSKKEWIAKLNEEVSEVIEAIFAYPPNRKNFLREMVDVSTTIRSMQWAFRFSQQEISDMQKWVNENNRERGYLDEPRG